MISQEDSIACSASNHAHQWEDPCSRALFDALTGFGTRLAHATVEAFVTTEGAQARQLPGKTELVFDKVGGREFLSQIWIEGSSEGYQVAKSCMQLKLEKSGASPQSHRLAVTHNKKGRS